MQEQDSPNAKEFAALLARMDRWQLAQVWLLMVWILFLSSLRSPTLPRLGAMVRTIGRLLGLFWPEIWRGLVIAAAAALWFFTVHNLAN